MRRLVLAALCLAMAGCGEDVGESGSCASGIVLHGDFYVGTSIPGPDPPAGRPVEGGIQPACNDSGAPLEEDHAVGLRAVSGVPSEVAVYPEWSTSRTYLNRGFPTQVPEHPLHERFYGSPDKPRRRPRGAPCRIDGEITSVDALILTAGAHEVWLVLDSRTRVEGLERVGLPYLKVGDRVRVHGFGCRRDSMLVRRITPQP